MYTDAVTDRNDDFQKAIRDAAMLACETGMRGYPYFEEQPQGESVPDHRRVTVDDAAVPLDLPALAAGRVCSRSCRCRSRHPKHTPLERDQLRDPGSFWLWVGVPFNRFYSRPTYSMAIAFVVLYVIEAGLLVVTGVFKQSLSYRPRAEACGVVGALRVPYRMVGYPVIEYLLGRGYPSLLPFGLVPCPLTVFALGLFLWTDRRLPWYVLVIPFLYSLSGVLPVSLCIVEDLGLVAGGLVAACMILYRDRARQAAG